MIKKTKGQELTEIQKKFNKAISKYRFKIEQTFGLLKKHLGFRRMRYLGIAKCELEFQLKSGAFNIKKAVHSVT